MITNQYVKMKCEFLKRIQNGDYEKLKRQSTNEILADYLTITHYHEMVRENKMSKDEFFTAVDDILCW